MTTARLSSWLLLAGILTGFLGATWHGHLAAGYSKPANFQRFHQLISADTLYYPPYAMLETLARSRWQPGKTLVVIGGNSVLNGVGQPWDEVWSQRLQEQLGESYAVINLAFRGADPSQGAALVAESLQARGLPVIYVANSTPSVGTGRSPGGTNGYFYWQALGQDRLSDHAPRDEATQRWLAALPSAERTQQDEERLGGRLEAWFRSQSLWHHVGYRHVFTVWNFVMARDSFRPRASFPDNEPDALRLEQRFQSYLAEEMAIVRHHSDGLVERDAAGRWQLTESTRLRLAQDIAAWFAPALRPRTLMLLNQNAPYYRSRLDPAEREHDEFVYAACAQNWRDHGIACEVVGSDFASVDYIDRVHLSNDGGLKLAVFVAEKIRQMPKP